MTIELDWHEGDEQAGIAWESEAGSSPFAAAAPQTIAARQRPHSRTSPRLRRLLPILVGIPVLLALVAGGVLFWRSSQGNELARQDIEATAALLLAAQRDGDPQALQGLLDPADSTWRDATLRSLTASSFAVPADSLAVKSVRLDGTRAMAEVDQVGADGMATRSVAFFRRSGLDGQWLLTSGQPDDFGAEQQHETTHFRITYRDRDEPLLTSMVNAAEGAFVALCGELDCQTGNRHLELQIQYAPDSETERRWGDLAVPSPWLLGVTPDGQAGPAFEEQLIRQLARNLVLRRIPAASPALVSTISDWASDELLDRTEETTGLLQSVRATGGLLPVQEAWRQVALRNDAQNPVASAQVRSMIAYLQDLGGSGAVVSLLDGINRSPRLEDVLRRSFQSDVTSFQRSWLIWLQDGSLPTNHTTLG